MQAELWTINGLAVELDRDRRSLARDLEGLKPDEETRQGARTVRRYRMARVVAHLYRATAATGELEDFETQRERLAAAQAEKVEMENAVRRGELAEVAKVHAVWTDHVAAARAKLLAMPTKLGPQLTNVADARVISARVRAEVHAALAELADYEPPDGDGEPHVADPPGGADVVAPAGPDRQRVGRRKAKAQ